MFNDKFRLTMKKIFIALSASLFLLGSCATSEEIDGVSSGGASFGDVVNFTSSVTRVTEGNQWEDNDEVGIYCGDYYSNIQYVKKSATGGEMEPGADVIYYVSKDDVTYTAYYPYSETIVNGKYPIDLSVQSGNVEDMYLLFASATTNETDVQLTFEHKLSMVDFIYKPFAGVTLSGEILLRLSNVGTTSTLDVTTGELSASPTLGTIEMYATASDDGVTFKTMMLPMSTLADIKIEFLVNGSWWQGDFGDLSAKSWESGKSYDYTVTASDGDGSVATSIAIAGESTIYTSGAGVTTALTATVYPVNAQNKSVTWSSQDESVAIVTSSGDVWGVSPGTTTITATSVLTNTVTKTFEVTVEKNALSIGDYLYDDGTYGAYYLSEKSPVGVVYEVGDDAQSGMLVSLDEVQSLAWATSNTDVLIFNNPLFADYTWSTYSLLYPGYGMEGTQEVHNYIKNTNAGLEVAVPDGDSDVDVDGDETVTLLELATEFPAFAWIADLNSEEVDYTTLDVDATGVWYMPGEGCLAVLLPAVVNNPIINTTIKNAGGTSITCDGVVSYLSSSEVPTNGANYRRVSCSADGVKSGNGQVKTTTNVSYRTRAIMAFDIDADFNE